MSEERNSRKEVQQNLLKQKDVVGLTFVSFFFSKKKSERETLKKEEIFL